MGYSDSPQTNVRIKPSRGRGRAAPGQGLVRIRCPVSAPRSMVSPKMLRISDGRIMVITSPQRPARPVHQKRSMMVSDVCSESTRRKVMANFVEGCKVVLEGKVQIEVKKDTNLQGMEEIIKHDDEENKRSEVFGGEHENEEIMYAQETSQPGLFQEVRLWETGDRARTQMLCGNTHTVKTPTQPGFPSSSSTRHKPPSSTHNISSLNRVPIVVPPGVTLPVSAKRIFPPLEGGILKLSLTLPCLSTGPVEELSSSDLNLSATVKSEKGEISGEDVKREIVDPEYLPKIKTECKDEFEDHVYENSDSNKVFIPDLPKEEILSRIKIEEMEFSDEGPKDLTKSQNGYTESIMETIWLPSESSENLVLVSYENASSNSLLNPD